MLAFNVLAFLHSMGRAPSPAYDPRNPSYDLVRRYIRAPKRPTEAWPFLERYDPPKSGGKVEVHVFDWGGVMIGRIRAYSFEFYVDLMNTGNLLTWAESQGIERTRFIAPGARYPASPTVEEVPPEERWWLRLSDGKIEIGTRRMDAVS